MTPAVPVPVQARHGPDAAAVRGPETVHAVRAGRPDHDRTALAARDLQLFAETRMVVSGSGRERLTLIVRCPYCPGHSHRHHAPVSVAVAFRRCPKTGSRYAIHSGVLA